MVVSFASRCVVITQLDAKFPSIKHYSLRSPRVRERRAAYFRRRSIIFKSPAPTDRAGRREQLTIIIISRRRRPRVTTEYLLFTPRQRENHVRASVKIRNTRIVKVRHTRPKVTVRRRRELFPPSADKWHAHGVTTISVIAYDKSSPAYPPTPFSAVRAGIRDFCRKPVVRLRSTTRQRTPNVKPDG